MVKHGRESFALTCAVGRLIVLHCHKDFDHALRVARLMLQYNHETSKVKAPMYLFFVLAAGTVVEIGCVSYVIRGSGDESLGYYYFPPMKFELT